MSTPLLCAALLIAGGIAGATSTFAASTQVVGQGAIVTTAGSTASLAFGHAGSLELRLDGSMLHVQGRVSAAGSLALTVDGRTMLLPDEAIDLSVEVGSASPVTAVVTHDVSSTATLTFTRADGHVTVSSTVANVSGSSTSVSTSTSTRR